MGQGLVDAYQAQVARAIVKDSASGKLEPVPPGNLGEAIPARRITTGESKIRDKPLGHIRGKRAGWIMVFATIETKPAKALWRHFWPNLWCTST